MSSWPILARDPALGNARNPRSIAAAALLFALWAPGAVAEERFSLAGREVAIFNLAGALRVEPSTGAQVVVEVRTGGRDAGRLKVESGPIGGVQTVRVIYPGSNVIYPLLGTRWTNDLQVGQDGRFGSGLMHRLGARQVMLQGGGRGLEAHADLRVLVPPGKKVSLYWGAGAVTVQRVDGDLRVENGPGSVTIAQTRGSLHLDSGSGTVKVTDVQGDVLLDSGSGSVSLSGVRGPRLRLDSGSGGVTGVDIEVDDLTVDTGSGNLRLDNLRAERILLDTGSGDVELDLRSDVEVLSVDAGSGDVTIACPKQLGAAFQIETGSGGVDIEPAHEITHQSKDEVRGRIGDGRGRIEVDSGSGTIRFTRHPAIGGSLIRGAGRFFGYPFE
ncbi:MAG TPA: DUF4097 family beta strand repeat-containing protein [Candidatus Limnocylindria bacterium]|nr:DUF4097 family beta strand repeat-containing protein [Candidatus Limnocylindria bacterium]